MSEEKTVECAKCGLLLDEPSDVPAEERQPCPKCGSTSRTFHAAVSATLRMSASASAEVERGLNDIRLAVVGILITIALSTAGLVGGPWWLKLVAGIGSFALACLVIRYRKTRHLLTDFAHRLTER